MDQNQPVDSDAHQLVVVAFYDQRPIEPLLRLVDSMKQFDAGCAYDLLIVVNSAGGVAVEKLVAEGLWCRERENLGMNIGAWDHGWREAPPNYDGFLFLQDDCVVVRDRWLAAFAEAATVDVGLVGESLNENWDHSWDELRQARGGIPMSGHSMEGTDANRVDVYIDFMRRNGIEPGPSGRHLRGQVWYARRSVLATIGGFPMGRDRGECIGAEIGVSRAMEAHGLALAQVSEEPFHFVRHTEWTRTSPDGPYRHLDSIGRLGRLRRRLTHPDGV